MSETPYVETEALLALLNGEVDECEKLLSEMLPYELARLADLAQMLSDRAKAHRHGQMAARRQKVLLECGCYSGRLCQHHLGRTRR